MGFLKNLFRHVSGTVLAQKTYQTSEGMHFDFSLKEKEGDKYIVLSASVAGGTQSYLLDKKDADALELILKELSAQI